MIHSPGLDESSNFDMSGKDDGIICVCISILNGFGSGFGLLGWRIFSVGLLVYTDIQSHVLNVGTVASRSWKHMLGIGRQALEIGRVAVKLILAIVL